MRLVTRGGIQQLLAANPIAAVAAERGIELAPLGKGLLIGRCPLEKEPVGRSLLVSPASGRYRCLVCWRGGNVIGLVQLDGLPFMAAVVKLAARAGLDLDALLDEPPPPRRPRRSEVPGWALTPPVGAR